MLAERVEKMMKYDSRTALAALAAVLWTTSAFASGPAAAGQDAATPQQRVAALKQSLQESQARLRRYEWIETTIVSLKGEEKSRKQQRCYYGADGKLQKLPLGDAAQQGSQARGRRGGRLKQSVVENKKEEMQEYMERASSLIHHYVPPNPDDIENAKNAGKIAVRPGQDGRVRLEFADYIKPGDLLAIDVDGAANRLTGLSVASYLDTRDDAVTLNVQFGALDDGTSYAAQTTLDAKAKNIRVVIQNAGHRPIGQ
jgi:hypothetical protein